MTSGPFWVLQTIVWEANMPRWYHLFPKDFGMPFNTLADANRTKAELEAIIPAPSGPRYRYSIVTEVLIEEEVN